MLSIGRFAKLAQVSPRTVRYYESIGLIASASRGDNNYRYYDQAHVERVLKIRDLQSLGFSLEEIHEILKISSSNLIENLRKKIQQVEAEMGTLSERHLRLKNLLSVSEKIESGSSINEPERRQYMEAIKEEILSGIGKRGVKVSEAHLTYLEREREKFSSEEFQEFFNAVKKCLQFAKDHNLKLGPGRGSGSSSLMLYSLGVTHLDPLDYDFYPERMSRNSPFLHLDVEFARGQEFVNYCKEVSKSLSIGEIEAFKMPLIDIVMDIQSQLANPLDFDDIDDDSDTIMNVFRTGEIAKIFQFDFSDDALVMKYENFLPEYQGLQKITEYLRAQKIYNFRDIINITALWRPNSRPMVERIERYRDLKDKNFSHDFLTPELQESLKPNFGLVIYHEDILRILSAYTEWSPLRCNEFRRNLQFDKKNTAEELALLKKTVPAKVYELIKEEAPYTFCQPHAIAFSSFTKQTAVLKSLHPELYQAAIDKWEAKHSFRWDDIGIKIKGVSLLQG